MKLNIVDVFGPVKNVSAYFTEANRENVNPAGIIPGLNLGYNTGAEKAEVDQNFKTLFSEIGWNAQNLAIAEQVHGTHIKIVDKPGTYQKCDGLITTKSDLAIGIRVADCAAVLIADPENKVIGAFHAGWRGAAENIIIKGIKLMIDVGGEVKNMIAYCSPCITEKNFEVGEEVAQLFPDQYVNRITYKKPHIDLQSYIRSQLLEMGLKNEHIEIVNKCTMNHQEFFSYRREREQAGRMLAMLKLNL